MYKQIIIARKDLDMSPGKLAEQVSHASMAFLTNPIKKNAEIVNSSEDESGYQYKSTLSFDVSSLRSGYLGHLQRWFSVQETGISF